MVLPLLEVASIVLAALVLGVFWGPWLALTRSIATLEAPVFLLIVHRLDTNLGRFMTVLFPVALLSMGAVLALTFSSPLRFALTAGGLLLFIVALVVTTIVEVPIVTQIRGWTVSTMPANWEALRNRWVSFHLLRVIPGILGLALLVAGAVWRR